MTKQIVKRRAFVPRLCPIRITPFLHRVKREWLTACLQQTPAGSNSRRFLLYGRCRFKPMCFLLFGGFSALFRLFWPLKFPVAPNQHRPFCDLRQEPSNTGPPPLPGALPHTHSKTACRGVSERQWRSAANRSRLPPRSVLGAPHQGAAPEPAGETKSFCPCQVYLPKMMQVRKKPGIPGFFRVSRVQKGPSRRDVFE